ncbi:MAG: hypothetical protein JO212_01070 [Acetobacteraceae bacterium]|nr:hypothetical protein [Acetobacteraceae bacterium]
MRHVPLFLLAVASLGAGIGSAGAQQQGAPSNPAMDAANQLPILPPEVIQDLARRLRASRRAAEEAANPPLVQPENRTVRASFRSDSAPILLRTVRGYPTSVTFVDSTGQPWPIDWEMAANPNSPGGTDCNSNGSQPAAATNAAAVPGAVYSTGFDACIPVKGGNTLVVTPRSDNARGALTVLLAGGKGPVSLMLQSNGLSLDQNFTVQMIERGPRARADYFAPRAPLPATGSEVMQQMLNGAPPADAHPLAVIGGSPDAIRAWELGGQLFVRMPYGVISPQADGWVHGQGDVTVYSLPGRPAALASSEGQPVLASADGQPITLRFRER